MAVVMAVVMAAVMAADTIDIRLNRSSPIETPD